MLSGYIWQDKYTAEYHRPITRLFFGDKNRSFLAAHAIMFLGFVGFVVISPSAETPEILGVLTGSLCMLWATGLGGWMNWRLGRWSFANRHKMVAYWAVKLTEEGKTDVLEDQFLEEQLRSMLGEAKSGNTASHEVLLSLLEREDELGRRIQAIVHELDDTFVIS